MSSSKNSPYLAKDGIFDKAVNFATKAHLGQTRKGSNTPYIEHPLEVADIARTMTSDEEVLSAAVLHDTVEDTDVSIDDIRKSFGSRVADLVMSDTENKRKGISAEKTWKIRKQETIDNLNKTSDVSKKILVLSDKLSNMRQLFRDYSLIGDEVWQRFHQKDKGEHEWYYKSILEATKDLEQYQAWHEYQSLIEAVFG